MNKSYRLSCITKNGTNPAYEGARLGAARVASRMGGVVQHSYPIVPDDISEQGALIEAALNEKPDAILLAPVHPTALNPVIRKIKDAGIPLIYFVSATEGIKPQTYITSNNHALAVAIAERLINSIGGSGNLALIEGSNNSPTSAPRTKGFLDAAAAHSDIRVVAQKSGAYQRAEAHQAMTDIL